MHQG